MTYEVESGVPVPPECVPSIEFPFAEMGVGDSFLVPATVKQKVRVAASKHGTRYARKYITRSTKEGVRVWRTE